MLQLQCETLELISGKIARLANAAEVAKQASRQAQTAVDEARKVYGAAPSSSTEEALFEAAVEAEVKFESYLDAEEVLKGAGRARDLVIEVLTAYEREGIRPV